jgi:hypothetical protein
VVEIAARTLDLHLDRAARLLLLDPDRRVAALVREPRERVVVGRAVGRPLAGELLQLACEGLLGLAQQHPVLGAPRPGEARLDVAEVELQGVGVDRLLGVRVVEEPLLARIGLDQRDLVLGAAREAQVAERLGVDREHHARGALLRRHVGDRGPVGKRQPREAGAVELDELPDHAPLAQHLGDGQHEVGGGRALGQLAAQLEPDHLRDQHRDRLAQHRGLGLDPADAPAQHAKAVHHRGVRVGADERVRVGHELPVHLLAEHDPREVLQVHLVADARVGRHDREVVERLGAPAQERVALAVALELALGVECERQPRCELVHLHGVVDHELGRLERVDPRRVPAQVAHRVAHRGEVDHGGHPGEVLEQHARGRVGDLAARLVGRDPLRQRLDVVGLDRVAALGAQQVLEQHLQRERQPCDVVLRLQRVEPEDLVVAAVDRERRACTEAVHARPPSRLVADKERLCSLYPLLRKGPLDEGAPFRSRPVSRILS